MNHIIHLCFPRINLKPGLKITFKRIVWPLLILMVMSSVSSANIYRCVSDSGVITYSDVPCGDNAVVAFKKHEVGVEEAAARDVIGPNTSRANLKNVLMDVVHHAKQVGSCILPGKEFISYTVSNPVTSYSSNLVWSVNLFFGTKDYIEWRINISYAMNMEYPQSERLRTISAARLTSIAIKRNDKPYDPASMNNLKAFKKEQIGAWRYKR